MEKKISKKISALLVILGGAGWGFISVFITPLSNIGMTSFEISAVRMLVAAPVFIIIGLITDRSLFKIKLKDIWIFVICGALAGVIFNVLYFFTIINSEASIAVMLLYTSPITVMVESYFLFKEKITRKKILSLVLTVLGCALVAGVFGNTKMIPGIVLLCGLATGVSYGTFTVFTRLATMKYKPLTVTIYSFIFGAVFMLPIGNLKEAFSILASDPPMIGWAVATGLVSSVLANLCFTVGIGNVEAGVGSLLAASEPLVATLVGIFYFHESTGFLKILGIILVMLSIIYQGLSE